MELESLRDGSGMERSGFPEPHLRDATRGYTPFVTPQTDEEPIRIIEYVLGL
jgi:hypothetical protein